MHKSTSTLITAFMIFSFFGCSSSKQIATLKPEPDNATPLVYDNSPSFINLPVTIKTKDIENQVNKALTGLIFDDSNLEDDNITVKVEGTVDINVVDFRNRKDYHLGEETWP